MPDNAYLPPFLTDDEIAGICEPLKMPAAQRRYLVGLGLIVKAKPNGKPLVARAEFERVLVGTHPGRTQKSEATEPNVEGLAEWAAARKRKPKKPSDSMK